MWGDVGEGEGS
jgi:hypothetical protein